MYSFGPNTLAMYVPTDPVIYLDKVVQLCTQRKPHPANHHNSHEKEKGKEKEEPSDESSCDEGQVPETDERDRERDREKERDRAKETVPWRSLFVLIPMRLGVDKINPMYPKYFIFIYFL